MPLGLPIDDVKIFVEDLINELGDDVLVDDTISTKAMISDLERTYNYMQENMKQVAISKDIIIDIGSKIQKIDDGTVFIVYTKPTDDLVSKSCRALVTNSSIIIKDYQYTYNDIGDITDTQEIIKDEIRGFVERKSGDEKEYDFGRISQSKIEFITFSGVNIGVDDIVEMKDKKFRCVDVNDLIDGLVVLTLESENHG